MNNSPPPGAASPDRLSVTTHIEGADASLDVLASVLAVTVAALGSPNATAILDSAAILLRHAEEQLADQVRFALSRAGSQADLVRMTAEELAAECEAVASSGALSPDPARPELRRKAAQLGRIAQMAAGTGYASEPLA
jgi:hypothetical protein